MRRKLLETGIVALGLTLLAIAVWADKVWLRALAISAFVVLSWAWEEPHST